MNLYPTGFRFLSLVLVLLFCLAPIGVSAQSGDPTPEVTPQDLINLMNSLRTQSGYGPLIVDPILMRTAQETADIMALNQAGGHIGDVRGRVSAAGYGAGDIPWATENFAVGPSTIDRIQQVWADPDHMRPAVNPNYEHIGAGVAEYNGRVYYIVHAAYTSNSVYQPGGAGNTDSSGTTEDPGTAVGGGISQVIYPVETSTPQAQSYTPSARGSLHGRLRSLTARKSLRSRPPTIFTLRTTRPSTKGRHSLFRSPLRRQKRAR